MSQVISGEGESQDVHRIAVITQRIWNKSVVGRVEHRRIEKTVNKDLPAWFVQLVLDRRMVCRNLDNSESHRGSRYQVGCPRSSYSYLREFRMGPD